jgi:excisionase family DNA binding protein
MRDLPERVGGGVASLGVDSASRLLAADDVANYLGVRTDWVYREVRAGRLPHIRLGRAVRFRRESIEAWIDSRERGMPVRRRP